MDGARLISYAQNGEDVVLWRALGHVRDGVYVDVGGWDPDIDSVTRVFYENGWSGIDVEPVPEFAAKFRERRTRNDVVQAAVTDAPVDEIVLHRFGSTGLSTLDDGLAAQHHDSGMDAEDVRVPALRLDAIIEQSSVVGDVVHFLKVDVEGAEAAVLRSVDLTRWRPWVLVVEATLPNSTTSSHHEWESLVLDAGYQFTLFDGLSRFYVAQEHLELLEDLSYPACALDNYAKFDLVDLEARVELVGAAARRATEDALQWRNRSVTTWAESMATAQAAESAARQAEFEAARLSRQLAVVRKKLRQARDQRTELHGRVTRLRGRVEKLTARTERMQARIASMQDEQQAPSPSTLRRLGGALKRRTSA